MKNLLAVLVVFVLVFGCSTANNVETQGSLSPSATATKGTYGWLDGNVINDDGVRIISQDIDYMVRKSVDKYLAAKGYAKVEGGKADYLLSWFGDIEREVKEIAISSFYQRNGYGSLLGTLPSSPDGTKVRKEFARGTLILDVLDSETKNLVWRGSATNTIHENMSNKKVEQYIDTSVENILESLPDR